MLVSLLERLKATKEVINTRTELTGLPLLENLTIAAR